MGIRLYQEPQLENPILVASWPGIGNIGITAVDTLRRILEAEEFGEIEPWEFFYPKQVLIRKGVLEYLEFPSSKFYFKRIGGRDVMLFIGEEQPTEGGRMYAEGRKAYRMADLVLDVVEKFKCRRIYTSGAAVALIHHTAKPRVWAVPNAGSLISEIKAYQNTVLMSDIEGRGGHGNITGLNGLLLGVAKKRGFEAICLMGEIPVYLQGLPFSYPKASKSVLEVLSHSLRVEVNLDTLDELDQKVQQRIEEFYQQIPLEIRGQLDRLKRVAYAQPAEPGPITEEEEKKIVEDVEKFFRKRGEGG
ncbi:MAG: PAC2 family protein [Dehalococcoidia bacterium]|jgi:proteasome assembly chaperone (PAC2) family protein